MSAFRVAILTASDKGYAGQREDLSGPAIREIVEANGYEVTHTVILPDDQEMLAAEIARICDEDMADLLLTTGGTGFSPRDCMPEATMSVMERAVPGIPEAMRLFSLKYSQRSIFSSREAESSSRFAASSCSRP